MVGMAKHSAFKPFHPYSAERTHRLHDRELNPSNTPLPVGNPNPHAPNVPWLECAQPHALVLPAGAGHICWGGGEGKSASPLHVCGDGGALSCRLPSPANPPWVWWMPMCAPEHPLQHRALWDTQLREAAKLPAAMLSSWMLFLQIVAVQMHSYVFSSRPPPRKRGVLPNPVELRWKGSTLNMYGESSGCQLLVCHVSSSVPCRNIVPARGKKTR